MSARGTGAFSPRTVLLMLVLGSLVFVLGLYSLGTGLGQPGEENGEAHAASNSLVGYSALAKLLERVDYEVALGRDRSNMDNVDLLVLTPAIDADPVAIDKIVADRRLIGPTILVLPKWIAMPVPANRSIGSKEGWVVPLSAVTANWLGKMDSFAGAVVAIKPQAGGEVLALAGDRPLILPAAQFVQGVASDKLVPLVEEADGLILAGYLADGAYHAGLESLAGRDSRGDDAPYGEDEDSYDDYEYDAQWPVVVVAEPDLLNNWGMAERDRAGWAVDLIDATDEDYGLPIRFDLTLNGLGHQQNLLTLAFTPPFLAATICLLIAALVVGWRAYRRFGPPVAQEPDIAFGKSQLVANGARLVQRAKRLHLLGPPFAALLTRRIAAQLGIRHAGDGQRVEGEIQRRLASRFADPPNLPAMTASLRQARGAHELLRAASALKSVETMLKG